MNRLSEAQYEIENSIALRLERRDSETEHLISVRCLPIPFYLLFICLLQDCRNEGVR